MEVRLSWTFQLQPPNEKESLRDNQANRKKKKKNPDGTQEDNILTSPGIMRNNKCHFKALSFVVLCYVVIDKQHKWLEDILSGDFSSSTEIVKLIKAENYLEILSISRVWYRRQTCKHSQHEWGTFYFAVAFAFKGIKMIFPYQGIYIFPCF